MPKLKDATGDVPVTTHKNGSKGGQDETTIIVKAPDIRMVKLDIRGNAPYVQHRFSEKAKHAFMAKQEQGQRAKKDKSRVARDFEADYKAAMYLGPKGEYGIPATAFRNGLIGQCRLVGFAMTLAKLSIFVEADFFDPKDGTPLIRLHGEPQQLTLPVRNQTGVADIRSRPMWLPGWKASVRVRFDADQFSEQDVFNLFVRLGIQGGVGEGRPNSKSSAGMGWGTFDVLGGGRKEETK